MQRLAHTSLHTRSALSVGRHTTLTLGSHDFAPESLLRLVKRNGWTAIKVLLVVLTTVLFLFQSDCKQTLLARKSPSGACTFVLTKLNAPQAEPEFRLSAER